MQNHDPFPSLPLEHWLEFASNLLKPQMGSIYKETSRENLGPLIGLARSWVSRLLLGLCTEGGGGAKARSEEEHPGHLTRRRVCRDSDVKWFTRGDELRTRTEECTRQDL